MKLVYIIVAALVSIVICYVYLNRTYSNETYIDSPYNLIAVDENGNMSTVSIHPPALNEPHIPPSTNIAYVDSDGNLGVIAYKDIGGSNRNILTVDSNNNFSVLTPPTAPSISIVSIIRQASIINPTCIIIFSVLTDPNLYPVTNYTFQFNNSNLISPVITNPETPNNVPKIFEQSLYLLNYPTLPNSLTSTFSFKIKAINAIGTSPSAQVSSVLNIPKSK
jgi:hypothetical protein